MRGVAASAVVTEVLDLKAFGDWFDPQRNRAQAQLDYWWEAARASEEAETDMFFVGGFQEFHSKTPSFHKTRRDRDWRVR